MVKSVIVTVDKAPLDNFKLDYKHSTCLKLLEDKKLFWCLFCKAFAVTNDNNADDKSTFWIEEEEKQFRIYARSKYFEDAKIAIEKIRVILSKNLKPNFQVEFVTFEYQYKCILLASNPEGICIPLNESDCSTQLFNNYIEACLPVMLGFLRMKLKIVVKNRAFLLPNRSLECTSSYIQKKTQCFQIYWKPPKARDLLSVFSQNVVAENASSSACTCQTSNEHPREQVTTRPSREGNITKIVVDSTEDAGEYFHQQDIVAFNERFRIDHFNEKFALFAATIKIIFSRKKYLKAVANLEEVRRQIKAVKSNLLQSQNDNPILKILIAKLDCLKAAKDQCKIVLKTRFIGMLEKIIFTFITLSKTLVAFEMSLGATIALANPKVALIGFIAASALFVYKMLLELYINRHNISVYVVKAALKMVHQKNRIGEWWCNKKYLEAKAEKEKIVDKIKLKGKLIDQKDISNLKQGSVESTLAELEAKKTLATTKKAFYRNNLIYHKELEKKFQSKCSKLDQEMAFNNLRGRFRDYDVNRLHELDHHLTMIMSDPAKKTLVKDTLQSLGILLPLNYTKDDLLLYILGDFENPRPSNEQCSLIMPDLQQKKILVDTVEGDLALSSQSDISKSVSVV